MSDDDPLTEEDLRFVVECGSGRLIRALAVVKLAKRKGKLEELREMINDYDESTVERILESG